LYNKGCDQCPVERVSWNDIQDFLKKLNGLTGKRYRLPTEAEWEYAARGGNQSRDFLYSGSNNIDEAAWYDSNAKSGNTYGEQKTTRPVGGKKANELGLYDMSGNVWEWCEDDWHGNYQGAPTDGRAWVDSPRGSYRVGRGGSGTDRAGYCRAANRTYNAPAGRGTFVGFRLALQ
jgi:formylglycine-generating enzyme required for sulfatase activity